VDGLNDDQLLISIEGFCDVPTRLEGEAAQLVGGDGVALISSKSKVFDAAGQQLTGDATANALAGADSVRSRPSSSALPGGGRTRTASRCPPSIPAERT
jgi:hypothetical protein